MQFYLNIFYVPPFPFTIWYVLCAPWPGRRMDSPRGFARKANWGGFPQFIPNIMDSTRNGLDPSESREINNIVDRLKKQGLFDKFRKECLADVDTKVPYNNNRIQHVQYTPNWFLTLCLCQTLTLWVCHPLGLPATGP